MVFESPRLVSFQCEIRKSDICTADVDREKLAASGKDDYQAENLSTRKS